MRHKVTFYFSQVIELDDPTKEQIERIGNEAIKRLYDPPYTSYSQFLRAELSAQSLYFAERSPEL